MRQHPVPALILFLSLLGACGGEDEASIADDVPSLLRARDFSGVALVLRGEETLLAETLGFADRSAQITHTLDTRFRIGSMTKAFTALAVIQLVEEGLIGFDTPVSKLFPDYPRGDEITVHHLLTHRSGLPDYLGAVDERDAHTPEELVGAIEDAPLLFSPGTAFSYSNTNYAALGIIVETLTGQPWSRAVADRILLPYGLEQTGFGADPIEGEGFAKGYFEGQPARAIDMSVPYAAGAMDSSAKDLVRWARLWMSGELFGPEVSTRALPEPPPREGVNSVGYGWFVLDEGGVRIHHHGGDIAGFTSLVALVPEQEGVIIVLMNREGQGALRNELLEAIVNAYFARAR